MAIKPEFIGLLRDIRDRIYPAVVSMYDIIVAKYAEITSLWTKLNSVTVVSPITVVPVQENGDPGLPDVTFNPATTEFTFSIPAGSKGQDLGIDYTVALTADLYSLVVEDGEIAFSNEDSKLYVKLFTGTNINASDWSTGSLLTPTTAFTGMTDTPVGYTGAGDYVVTVNAEETALVFQTFAAAGATELALKLDKAGGTVTGQIKGITPLANEDLARKDYVDTKAALAGATFSGQAKGITPVSAEDFTRKDYVDTKNNTTTLGISPIGGIIMYNGLLSDIPANWKICNGANGTPNLVGRMALGTATQAEILATGGNNNAVAIAHTHTGSTSSAGAHTHTYTKFTSGITQSQFGGSVYWGGQTTDTSSAGAHTHTISINSAGEDGTNKNLSAYVKLAYIQRIS